MQLDADVIPLEDSLKYMKNGDLTMLRKVLNTHKIRDASFIRGIND